MELLARVLLDALQEAATSGALGSEPTAEDYTRLDMSFFKMGGHRLSGRGLNDQVREWLRLRPALRATGKSWAFEFDWKDAVAVALAMVSIYYAYKGAALLLNVIEAVTPQIPGTMGPGGPVGGPFGGFVGF